MLGDHQILSNVYQTTGQVTGVGRLQGGIRQTLTGTVGGVKVLKYVQTFTEVRSNRRFDDRAVWLGHQTTHTRQLTNLGRRAPGTRVGHHVNAVEGFLVNFVAITVNDFVDLQVFHHLLGQDLVGTGPDVDNLVVLLACCYQTLGKLTLDLTHFVIRFINNLGLLWWDNEIVNTDRGTGNSRIAEAHVHQLVSKDNGFFKTNITVSRVQQMRDRLFLHGLINHGEWQTLRHNFPQQNTTNSGLGTESPLLKLTFIVLQPFGDTHLYLGVQIGSTGAVSTQSFADVLEHHAFTLGIYTLTGDVIQTQYHILGRYDNWFAVRWCQNIVGRHHQGTSFELGFQSQRYVHRHLVTVEVSVVCRTHQWVQLDRFTFDQYRFERLNTETVQCWRTVQHNRMFADHFVENIPNDSFFTLNHLLGSFDRGRKKATLQLTEDKWLEQFQRHFLGQTALVQTQSRTYGDNRTTGVVDTLTEQVLTETTLLTLDHISQRLQRTLVRTGNGTTTATIIQQRIHRLLQHPLFVTDDDVRCT